MYKSAASAYNRTKRLALPPREIEAMAFSRAAHLLEKAAEGGSDYAAKVSALKFNQMVWTFIQSSVTEKTCSIPAGLKADILELSLFIDKQTFKALAHATAENIGVLVRINKILASGLLAKAENGDEDNPLGKGLRRLFSLGWGWAAISAQLIT